jgi:hypothetical protein
MLAAAMLAVVKLVEAPGGDTGFHLSPSSAAALGRLERSDRPKRVRNVHGVYVCIYTGSRDILAEREE